MSRPNINISVDGPVASGKTTVGRMLAGKLGITFLDTGIMYRAVTWLALNKNISPSNPHGLSELVNNLIIDVDNNIGDSVEINGIYLKDELVDPQVVDNVSEISKHEFIRKALVSQQRLLASTTDIVMVGRDIGTVVLPNANPKIYISASLPIRAKRRWLELKDNGISVNYSQILESTQNRDLVDSNRTTSPLAIAHDALVINTDTIDAEQAIELIMQRLIEITQTNPTVGPI
ncbi:MAG: (d)CMP kinase [Chloroflexota bacterium]|nr:(d)CMP kinase [Chloroflexota bacterium]